MYRIVASREGEVVVAASFVGYASQRQTVTLSGDPISLDFQLSSDALGLGEVFVTGVVNPVSKIQSSVSISTLEPEAIEATVPRTTAEIFRSIPGIRSEASAGDGNTNITVRGVPISAGGSKYLQLQEDGLPILLYGDIAFGTADIFLRADPTVARVEAIRGGSASTLASNSPAGVVNFISKTGQVAGGNIAMTSGIDYNFQRIDFDFGSPLGDDVAFHVGGFLRTGEGERDAGYLAQQGGQIKANLTRFFDSGYVRVYGKYLNDRTPAYMPQPIAVSGSNDSPEFSDAGSLGINDQSNHTPRLLSNFTIGGNGERRRVNISDGLHPVSAAAGMEVSFDLGNGFQLDNKGRFALNSGRFVAPFTAVVGDRSSVLASLEEETGRDLSDAQLTRAEDGQAVNGNLLQGIVLFDTELENFNNVFNDASLSKSFADDDLDLTVTAGLFTGTQRINMSWLWNSYIATVEGEDASLVNVVDDDGEMITEDGLAAYGALFFGNCCGVRFDATYDIKAPYAGIEFRPTPELSLDASVRYEMANVSGMGSGGVVAAVDVNNDGELSNPESRANIIDQASRNSVDYSYDYVSFSAGANYTLSDASAAFARYLKGHSAKADRAIFPTNSYIGAEALGIDEPYDLLNQAEVGYKHLFGMGGLFVTGFYAATTEQGGFEATTQEVIDNDYRAMGVEIEGVVEYESFNLRGATTYTNAEITSGDNDGNTPRRQPDLLFSLVPSYSHDYGTVGVSVLGQTKSYAQDSNELVLPAFAVFNAFAEASVTDRMTIGLAVNNLLNSVGITESEEGSMDGIDYIRARSISGRTLSASLRFGF